MRRHLIPSAVGGGILAMLLSFSRPAAAIGFDAEKAYDSVFVLQSGTSLGSGFAFGSNVMITNAHVIEDERSIFVTDHSGSVSAGQLIAIDYDTDLAAVAVEGADYTPFPPGDIDSLSAGADVYAIGAPNSMSYTLTKGVISSKDREINGMSYIQTDAAINKGNSGGPLLDDSGSVIGVNSMKLSDSEGIGLAIPIGTVAAFLEENHIATGSSGNITGNITPPGHEAEYPRTTEAPVTEKPTEQSGTVNVILLAALGVSAALNVLLVILLVFEKRRTIKLRNDPSERTDFDIDILE